MGAFSLLAAHELASLRLVKRESEKMRVLPPLSRLLIPRSFGGRLATQPAD
jgi:hypothetical protein